MCILVAFAYAHFAVSLDDKLAAEARELGINVSEAAREGLRRAIRHPRAARDSQAYRAHPELEHEAWQQAETWDES